jgi:fructoselysine-6-P-deglycase FrlB-like protein
MTDTRDIGIMRREIETIPDVIDRQTQDVGPQVAELVERLGRSGLDDGPLRVVVTGCGDSYFAAMASRLAFSEIAGTDAAAIEALEFARYEAGEQTPSDLRRILIAVSYSGEVGRTIEAAMVARARGWHTIAVTGRPDGRLAGVVDDVVGLDVPTLDTSPGTTTYVSLLVALALIASELAEARGRSQAHARFLESLRMVPELAQQTLSMSATAAEGLAELLRDAELPMFLGAGPSLATAHFGAAKIFEGVQRPALVEHLEEWAHLQYFVSGPKMPTIVVAPHGPSRSRADELLSEMHFIETPGVLVTDDSVGVDPAVRVLPFAAGAPEALSPLLSCLPLAYAVALLATQLGTRSYGFQSEAHEREHYETIHRLGPVDGSGADAPTE